MKKAIFLVGCMFLLLFASCNQELANSDVSGIDEFNKAGTGYTYVNTFDADGKLCDSDASYNKQAIGTPMELWVGVGNADAGTLVGYVTFLEEGGKYYVKIDLTQSTTPWPVVVNTAHIQFADALDGIPTNGSGNPVVGQFEYNVDFMPGQTMAKIEVDGFKMYGAIHLDVGNLDPLYGFQLTSKVMMNVSEYTGEKMSYFQMEIKDGGFLDGIYKGWCIDIDTSIKRGQDYMAHIFSTYEDLPQWLKDRIEQPGNLNKLNYIINNYDVGDEVPLTNENCEAIGGTGILTSGDIQNFIWLTIDDEEGYGGTLGPYDIQRVNALICDANDNGGDYRPECGDKLAFLVVPEDAQSLVQITMGYVVIPCEDYGGTAWGDGKYGANFPDAKQWGTYFLYDETCGVNP